MARKRKTAAELLAELSQDSEFVERSRKAEKERSLQIEKSRLEQAVLVKDIQATGVPAGSVWDLVNSENNYDDAIPVLIEHLSKNEYSDGLREGIVRALTCRAARGRANGPLFEMFSDVSSDDLRWVVGGALAETATEDDIVEIHALLREDKYGGSRSMLVHALARLVGDECLDTLEALTLDEEMLPETLEALGSLKSPRAHAIIERFADHPDSWVRNIAKKMAKRHRSRK